MLNADEYNKLEEGVKKERKEPSFIIKSFFATIFSIGVLLFLTAVAVMPVLDAYDACDLCPLDYYEDAHLSKVCRYTPEPHIIYQRECYIERPYKHMLPPMVVVGVLMTFGAQCSYYYYVYKLNL